MADLSTTILDNFRQPNSRELWDRAIADAEEMIGDETAHVRRLKRSVKMLRELRDTGAAFPSIAIEQIQKARAAASPPS